MNVDLAEVVVESLGIAPAECRVNLVRETCANWDSLAHLRLITAVEKRFRIELSMREVQSIESLGDLDELVSTRLTPK